MKIFSFYYKKYKLFILTGLTFLGLITITYAVLVPKIQDLFTKRQTIVTKQASLTKLIAKRRLLDSMKTGDNAKYFVESEKALPSEKDASGIMAAMDNISSKAQYGIASINLNPGVISSKSAALANSQKETMKNLAYFLPIKIVTRGETQNFMNFLKELPNSRPLFDIENITIAYLPDQANVLEASFVIDAYYLPSVKQIGSVESDLPEMTVSEKNMLTKLNSMPYLGDFSMEIESSLPVGKSDLFTP